MMAAKTWFDKQRPGVKLVLNFLIYFAWWFLVNLSSNAVFQKQEPLIRTVLGAAFMGLGFTVFFQWKNVKAVFGKTA